VVGRLLRFTEIDPRSSDNEVDAAVAKPNDGVHPLNNIPGIGSVSGIRDLTLEGDSVVGLQVQKFGAATGRQDGRIKNIHVSTSIVYRQLSGDPSVDFIELVEYDGVSKEGDSGAAVLDTSLPERRRNAHRWQTRRNGEPVHSYSICFRVHAREHVEHYPLQRDPDYADVVKTKWIEKGESFACFASDKEFRSLVD